MKLTDGTVEQVMEASFAVFFPYCVTLRCEPGPGLEFGSGLSSSEPVTPLLGNLTYLLVPPDQDELRVCYGVYQYRTL